MQVVRGRPFELTESAVVAEVGGKREKAFDVLNHLKANGLVVIKSRGRKEGERTVTRNLVGLGRVAAGGSSSEAGTSSERVQDD